MMRLAARIVRRSVGGALALAILAAPAAATAATAAERELARRYAPIMMLKENPDPPCSRDGEQYRPAPVEITLANPDVRLLRPKARGAFPQTRVLASGPTAAGVVGLGSHY